jgi:hypothetical protein
MASEPATIREEDRALIERVARRIVELQMDVPAILTLESGKPLSLLASQTLIFLEPIVLALLPIGDYRRFAQLIERREVVEALIQSIEAGAEARRAAKRAEADARRARSQ